MVAATKSELNLVGLNSLEVLARFPVACIGVSIASKSAMLR